MTGAGEDKRSALNASGVPEHPGYRAFLYSVTVLGGTVLATVLYRIMVDGVAYQWIILTTLAVIAGAATVKIPGTQ